MDLQHLHTFIAVAEHRSLTRAAEAVHLSQPAVSGHIKQLEHELGLALFRRTGRGMELTPGGEQLLQHAREITLRCAAMERKARDLAGESAGALRLGLIDCGTDLRVARIVALLREQFPDIVVEFTTNTSGKNVDAL